LPKMPTREEYNACMVPFMKGQKGKQERQHDMCVGAKICSGKVTSKDEAEKICSAPRLPKWAKQALPEELKTPTCEDRITRAKSNIEVINLKVRAGEAEEVKGAAAQVMDDIFHCLPEPAVVEMVTDAMEQFHDLSKRFYFKGEGKEVQSKLELIKEVLP